MASASALLGAVTQTATWANLLVLQLPDNGG